jgi:threonine/homoserine efflux transporter RhtA
LDCHENWRDYNRDFAAALAHRHVEHVELFPDHLALALLGSGAFVVNVTAIRRLARRRFGGLMSTSAGI